MKNKKIKIREDVVEVVEEVYMRLENFMDWYKEDRGGGEFSDDWIVEEVKGIMKMLLSK